MQACFCLEATHGESPEHISDLLERKENFLFNFGVIYNRLYMFYSVYCVPLFKMVRNLKRLK